MERTGRTSGLIFGVTPDKPFGYTGVHDRAVAAGVLQLHECRHTCRTLMREAGIIREHRDWYLGHADHSVGGRYEHPTEGQYLDDAKTFSEYVCCADSPTRVEQLSPTTGVVQDVERPRVQPIR